MFTNKFDLHKLYNQPSHRCNARARCTAVANDIQLEKNQLINPQPVTLKHVTNTVELQQQLNHKVLLKT